MAPKNKTKLAINMPPPIKGFGGLPANSTASTVHPANPTVGPPTGLTLTTATGYSSAAPTAVIDATWTKPLYSNPANYTIQVSTDVTFATSTITAQTFPGVESAHIEGLLPGTLYYVRVKANVPGVNAAWSSMSPLVTGQNRITTATDTTAAGVPTSPAAVFFGTGHLRITWVNPTNANFKTVHIRVRASSGGTIYREWDSRTQIETYTVEHNLQDTGGVGDPSLYVEMYSVTFSNVNSATVNTGLVTKAVPATPSSVTQSWSGDTGTATADLTLNWAEQGDAAFWYVSFNGLTARRTSANTYTYTYSRNVADNGGAGDPTLTYGIQAVDGLGQGSTTASGSATNAAPPTPTVTLSDGFQILVAVVGGTQAGDFAAYEYVWKRDATTVRTLESPSKEQQYERSAAADDGYHSWTVVVRQKDAFGQFSSTVTSSAIAGETLTLAGLRQRISYTDSIATAPATLKTAMSDDVRDSGGVSYAA